MQKLKKTKMSKKKKPIEEETVLTPPAEQGAESAQGEQTEESGFSRNQIENEIFREKYRKRYRKIVLSTVYVLVIIAAIALLIAALIMPVIQIAGEDSMSPTLNKGEIILAYKTKKIEKGDICACYYNNKVLVKRIIAVGGETIDIDKNGNVKVDGKIIEEPYVTNKSLGHCDVDFPYTVPENSFFVIGDNRKSSLDSRTVTIGCIPEDNIMAKAWIKFWPLKEFGVIA